jgi:hypothetical protein
MSDSFVEMFSGVRPQLFACRDALAIAVLLGVQLSSAWPAGAALQSGTYQTIAGATVQEVGDNVTNGSRVVPITATLTFDLATTPRLMTAVIHDAVIEGGSPYASFVTGGRTQPFELTVHNETWSQEPDGTYQFTGDYLKDIRPSGTQYTFSWQFSTATNGDIVWNGNMYWAGGHIWVVTVSNIVITGPSAHLSINAMTNSDVELTWQTNFSGHVLEYAESLSNPGWSTVTNGVTNNGIHMVHSENPGELQRFFRLRQP